MYKRSLRRGRTTPRLHRIIAVTSFMQLSAVSPSIRASYITLFFSYRFGRELVDANCHVGMALRAMILVFFLYSPTTASHIYQKWKYSRRCYLVFLPDISGRETPLNYVIVSSGYLASDKGYSTRVGALSLIPR